LFSHTELRYTNDGKTVDITQHDAAGAIVQSTTQSGDDQGHVVTAVIRDRDWRTKQMKARLKVSFRYDRKERLIEQDTDAHEFDKSGSEQELPPGKISIAYSICRDTTVIQDILHTPFSGSDGENKRGCRIWDLILGGPFPGRRRRFREPIAQHCGTKQKAPGLRRGLLLI
jgi:hypothetical protein